MSVTNPPRSWSDADLFALTRDTSQFITHDIQGNRLGDYFDARQHVLPLYTIARNICWPDPTKSAPDRPPLVLEIGVRHGVTTMGLLHAMRETGGKLISLDIDPDTSEATRQRIESVGLDRWWELHVIHSGEFAEQCPTPLDFVWIDGDHRYEGVKMDVELYAPKVRVGGMMAFHDYFSDPACALPPLEGPYRSEVSIAVEELRASGQWEVFTYPWSFGLTVARKLR